MKQQNWSTYYTLSRRHGALGPDFSFGFTLQFNVVGIVHQTIEDRICQGCIISIDAIGMQKDIVSTILEGEGGYLLEIKKNQGTLYNKVDSAFSVDYENQFKDALYDHARKVNKAHGKIEIRECWVTSDHEYSDYIDPNSSWQQLRSLAIVKATRLIEGETSSQIRYFISSVEFGADRLMNHIRRHWEIENKLHWSLDVSFREDESRVRTGHAPENLALILKMALNLLKLNKSKKCGVKAKRMLYAFDTNFLLGILNSCLCDCPDSVILFIVFYTY